MSGFVELDHAANSGGDASGVRQRRATEGRGFVGGRLDHPVDLLRRRAMVQTRLTENHLRLGGRPLEQLIVITVRRPFQRVGGAMYVADEVFQLGVQPDALLGHEGPGPLDFGLGALDDGPSVSHGLGTDGLGLGDGSGHHALDFDLGFGQCSLERGNDIGLTTTGATTELFNFGEHPLEPIVELAFVPSGVGERLGSSVGGGGEGVSKHPGNRLAEEVEVVVAVHLASSRVWLG